LKFNLSFTYGGQMRNITEFSKLIVISANIQYQIQSQYVRQTWGRNMANGGHITYVNYSTSEAVFPVHFIASCSDIQAWPTASLYSITRHIFLVALG
jgi:hypothetical protein